MPNEWKSWSIPAKMTAGSVALLLVSMGLCAVGGDFLSAHPSLLTSAGVICFFVSVVGLFVGVIWLVIAAIAGSGRR